jgi:post-segregation antitoxin (ccd killing protein)
MTIYLPDELGQRVKEVADLNVSAVCQNALEVELNRRASYAELDQGMKRHVVYIDELGAEAAFVGNQLLPEDRRGRTPYLTQRHRIAIYDSDAQALYQFENFDDLAQEEGWQHEEEAELVAAIAAALGEEHTIELDI